MIDPQPDRQLTPPDAEVLLEEWLGRPVVCSDVTALEGGMINSVFRLDFDRPPHRAVVKLHSSEGNSFAAEARSLQYLRSETACPVPKVYFQDGSARLVPHAFLLLEYLPGICLESVDLEPNERVDIDRQLAEVLGELHSHKGTGWGPVGATSDSTAWADLFSARLTEARAHPAVAERLGPEVLARVDAAMDVAGPSLSNAGTPTLVFGDIWDGNLMARREGGRWLLTGLLDPDLQFADRELELAYLEVFDHRREALFDAYSVHHPLRPGYEQRRRFYWLHTALIHVGLFGDEFFCQFTDRTATAIIQG